MLMLIALLAVGQASGSCSPPKEYTHWLEIEAGPARQGRTLSLSPTRGVSYVWEGVPSRCIAAWKLSDPKLASLSKDRSKISIASDATPGSSLTVSYRLKGQRDYRSKTVKIVARDAVVLNGLYHQSSLERCRQSEKVGELELTDDRFAVTYAPFESYKDYWGRYSFDAATGRLSLIVEEGNFVPTGTKLEGTARMEKGKLVLDGFDLGGRQPTERDGADACLYRF